MDERTRQIYERAFDTLDRLADFEPELRDPFADDPLQAWQHERVPTGVNAQEWLASRKAQPQPQPQRSAATMDATTQAGWDRWAEAHIKNALAEHLFTDTQVDVVAEFVSEYVHEKLKAMRAEFNAELGKLRADLAIATGVARGEIAQLKGKSDAA